MSDDELAELTRLHEAATPPPWNCGGEAQISLTFDREANIFPPAAGPGEYQYGGPVAVVSVDDDDTGETANAELITAMRNALPKLLAEVERLKGANAELAAAADHMIYECLGTPPARVLAAAKELRATIDRLAGAKP